MILGFSSGALYKTGIPINERIAFFKQLGCAAIELGYGKEDRLETEPLDTIDSDLLAGFPWVSLHAPVEGYAVENSERSRAVLEKIENFHKRRSLNLVVFHPYSIKDFSVFADYSFPFAVENMDNRKESFQSGKSLRPLFERNPELKFVFDLNHCYTNDPSLVLARELYNDLKDRLAEYHISGFQKLHEPFYASQKDEILAAIPDRSIPMIVESQLPGLEGARREYEYIMEFFSRKNL